MNVLERTNANYNIRKSQWQQPRVQFEDELSQKLPAKFWHIHRISKVIPRDDADEVGDSQLRREEHKVALKAVGGQKRLV